MEKNRCVWVVECSLSRNWKIMSDFIFATRQEARNSISKLPGDQFKYRVVKYVPAVEPKRTHKKEGVK